MLVSFRAIALVAIFSLYPTYLLSASAMTIKTSPSPPRLTSADPSMYLSSSQWIDCEHPDIQAKASELAKAAAAFQQGKSKTNESDNITNEIIRQTFEFVRDDILHSCDHQQNPVTCKASDVLQYRTGYCYAKSHLLAALLRANGIPTGLCYQRLTIADDDSGPPYCLHGLNAVYLEASASWYRIDPRGLKPNIQQAAFTPPKEQLAFPVRPDIGEVDFPHISVEPIPIIVESLTTRTSWRDVLEHLPDAEELQE